MKAEELMIGDWVYCEGQPTPDNVTIETIAEDGVWFNGPNYEGAASYDRIFPISLTPEILEKNFGVVERTSDGYNLVINSELILAFHLKATLDLWIAQTRDWPHLTYSLPLPRYVHELQHCLKLCGINKTIEL